jgi:hypothetical protein
MDFESNPYSLDSKGAQAQQKPASQQKAAQPAAQPEPITAAEQFALLTQKSASALDAAAASSQAQSAYRRQKERTHIAGNITTRGISSVMPWAHRSAVIRRSWRIQLAHDGTRTSIRNVI